MKNDQAARALGSTSGHSLRKGANPPHRQYRSLAGARQTTLATKKRGKLCTIAKLVVAEPLHQLVLAMPYRHRQTVGHVSVPPAALTVARQRGATWWIVRLDQTTECFGLPLKDVEAVGWLKTSEGQPEWFVSMTAFQRIPWQQWPYVESTLVLSGTAPATPPKPLQLSLEVLQ